MWSMACDSDISFMVKWSTAAQLNLGVLLAVHEVEAQPRLDPKLHPARHPASISEDMIGGRMG